LRLAFAGVEHRRGHGLPPGGRVAIDGVIAVARADPRLSVRADDDARDLAGITGLARILDPAMAIDRHAAATGIAQPHRAIGGSGQRADCGGGAGWPGGGATGWNVVPSKRNSPSTLPTHRNPSRSWASDWTKRGA
jgi:hypothetical protein